MTGEAKVTTWAARALVDAMLAERRKTKRWRS
jgi:hypothetical protein